MKNDGQATQMALPFSKPVNLDTRPTISNVTCLQQARSAIEVSRAKNKENEVVNKILKASKMLNW